jgi:hypothetical protein
MKNNIKMLKGLTEGKEGKVLVNITEIMKTIEYMMNELKHHTNQDVEEMTVAQIIEAYTNLFGEE